MSQESLRLNIELKRSSTVCFEEKDALVIVVSTTLFSMLYAASQPENYTREYIHIVTPYTYYNTFAHPFPFLTDDIFK